MGEFKSPSEKQSAKATPAKKSQENSSVGEADFLDSRSSTFQLKKFQEAAQESGRGSGISQLQTKSSNHTGTSRVAQLQGLSDARTSSTQPGLIQRKENKTGIPDGLKAGMESVSGMSLNDVTVHRNSDKPAQLQAHAYAQGTDVHLAPGQEKHLPHELGHVVQQKQGRVAPTVQLKGQVPVNDSPSLEKEADSLGAKAKSLEASAEAGVAQLKGMEEEELVQGKFVGPAQRKAVEEEEPVQGKFEGTAQRKAAEEEEVLQGKFDGTVQRNAVEGEAAPVAAEPEVAEPEVAAPEVAAPEAEAQAVTEETVSIGGFTITYTNDPNEKKQSISGEYEDSDWSISGERQLKDEAKNVWEYTITGGTPASLTSPELGFDITLGVIPLGVPGLSATIGLAGSLEASASGSGSIKFLSDGNTITNPSAEGNLTAGVEASVTLSGGVTAGIPGIIGVTGGAYGKLSGEITGDLTLKPTASGIKMDSKLAGEVAGEAGVFAEANALWYTKRTELPLCEGKFGEFEGTKTDLPFSAAGFKELASISTYNFKRDSGDDGKAAKEREKAAGDVKEEAVEAQKAEVAKGKEKKPWYRW
jgi:hypothetical protein